MNKKKTLLASIYCVGILLNLSLSGCNLNKIVVAPPSTDQTANLPGGPRARSNTPAEDYIGKPLMILLDNSGSMGNCSIPRGNTCEPENPKRLDIAKEEIRHIIHDASFDSTQIGLMEFGNFREYGQTLENSCNSFKPLVPVNSNNRQEIDKALNQVSANDDGVTPIGGAIRTAFFNELKDKGLLPARILVITDGDENCTSNQSNPEEFCEVIDYFATKKIQLFVGLVGYKIGNNNDFEKCEREYPGNFKYWGSANNQEELRQKINQASGRLPSKPKSEFMIQMKQ